MKLDWSWLAKIAPAIATVLGGPFAGIAVEVVAQALGIEAGPTENLAEKVTGILNSGKLTAEQIAAIKLAEVDLKVRLKELDIKLEEIAVEKEKVAAGDRLSARALFEKGFQLISWLSVLTIGGFYASIYFVMTGGIKGMDANELLLVGTVIGYIAANTQQVYSYFFGSSSGSDRKNDMLQEAIKKTNGNGNGHA